MANKLLIKTYNPKEDLLVFPLTKDPMLETETKFSNIAEVVPAIADAFNVYTLLSAGASGGVSEDTMKTKNLFDIKRWTGTDPLRFACDLILHTKTNAYKDVYSPAKLLMEQVILSKDNTGRFIVPGISLASMEDFQSGDSIGGISKKAKVISAWVPGMFYIPLGMIEKVQVTFSKEVTDRGYPLWATLNVNIESIMPANTDYFDNVNFDFYNLARFNAGVV